MSARVRKFIGLIVILAFLAFYALVVVTLSRFVPEHWALQLAYYAVLGTAWTLPLFPVIAWMQRGR